MLVGWALLLACVATLLAALAAPPRESPTRLADPPRPPGRLRWKTRYGAMSRLDEVSLVRLRLRQQRSPFTGVPVWCAKDEHGAWLVWPRPGIGLEGEVVDQHRAHAKEASL